MPPVMKKGDRRPRYRVQLKLDDVPVNLTGNTGIRFLMKTSPSSSTYVVDGTASVVAESTGIVEHAWAVGETDTPGTYAIEFEVDWSGEKQTFPSQGYFQLTIEPDLG